MPPPASGDITGFETVVPVCVKLLSHQPKVNAGEKYVTTGWRPVYVLNITGAR